MFLFFWLVVDRQWASCHAVDDDRVLADWRDIQHIERLGYIRLKFYI